LNQDAVFYAVNADIVKKWVAAVAFLLKSRFGVTFAPLNSAVRAKIFRIAVSVASSLVIY
jgi:hypothetical protein